MTEQLATDIQARELRPMIARIMPRRGGNRTPLAIAAFIAIPCSSPHSWPRRSLEKPHEIQWVSRRKAAHDVARPDAEKHRGDLAVGARAAAVLIVVRTDRDAAAARVLHPVRRRDRHRRGCRTRSAVWERHHTLRYPVGVDLIPPSNAASD